MYGFFEMPIDMQSIRTIKTVQFVPDLQNLETGLLERYRVSFENTCTKQSGYILRVNHIARILRRKLSTYNGHVIVDCEVDLQCLLPQEGMRLQGTIRQEFAQGWIVMVQQCMKVFVPREMMHSGTPAYKVDDPVCVQIVQTRFQKGKYDCIGRFVDDN